MTGHFSHLKLRSLSNEMEVIVQNDVSHAYMEFFFIFFFYFVCLTGYFVFSIAVLPHSPGVVYFHLILLRLSWDFPCSFFNINLRSFCV